MECGMFLSRNLIEAGKTKTLELLNKELLN